MINAAISPGLSWLGIARLGLVQAGLGSVVVLTTSTLNRVMVIELHLAALIPGVLVGLHYTVQVLRPRLGYGSDLGGRRTPWIVGGMAMLGMGAVGAALSVALMVGHPVLGFVAALLSFLVVGVGVGAAGTSLLTLLAHRVDARLRAPAATIVWLMMIAGIAVTSGIAGQLLDPFSITRLVAVLGAAGAVAFVVATLAVWGMEGAPAGRAPTVPGKGFTAALREIWSEPQARAFALFVFVSMLAYSSQELVIEPFAGAVFGLAPGQSASLTGLHHAGVLAGMAVVAISGFAAGGFGRAAMRGWTVGGCVASAIAVMTLGAVGMAGPDAPLQAAVLVLGVANGAFAVAAIGAMMGLASSGRASREGTRMGLWGAAQALAFGLGGLLGTGAADLAKATLGAPDVAYAAVFAMEAVLFLLAAGLALNVFRTSAEQHRPGLAVGGAA